MVIPNQIVYRSLWCDMRYHLLSRYGSWVSAIVLNLRTNTSSILINRSLPCDFNITITIFIRIIIAQQIILHKKRRNMMIFLHKTGLPFATRTKSKHQHYQLSKRCEQDTSYLKFLLHWQTVSRVQAANIVQRPCSDSSHVTAPEVVV